MANDVVSQIIDAPDAYQNYTTIAATICPESAFQTGLSATDDYAPVEECITFMINANHERQVFHTYTGHRQ